MLRQARARGRKHNGLSLIRNTPSSYLLHCKYRVGTYVYGGEHTAGGFWDWPCEADGNAGGGRVPVPKTDEWIWIEDVIYIDHNGELFNLPLRPPDRT